MSLSSTPMTLFLNLPPAYFSPSVPPHVVRLFIAHGGHVLPSPSSRLVNPLDLPVSYFFVTPDDSLIPHLTQRPIVLFDAEWVSECIRQEQIVQLGFWIVSVRGEDEVSQTSSKQSHLRHPECTSRQSDASSNHKRSSSLQKPFFTPTQPTPARSTSRSKRQRQIVAPRLLLDFDQNTAVNLLGEEAGDIIADLAAEYDAESIAIPTPFDERASSKRKTSYDDQYATKKPQTFQVPPQTTRPTSKHQSRTDEHQETANTDLASRRSREYSSPPTSSEEVSRNVNLKVPSPARYMLDEVMELLKETNGALEEVEVVGGAGWRVEKRRRGG